MTLKSESRRCLHSDEVKAAITEWLDYYNNRRYQWQLARLAPNEFYQYQVTGVYPISGVTVPSEHLDS